MDVCSCFTHTHTHPHTLSHSHTHTLTHAHTHTCMHSNFHSHRPHTHALTQLISRGFTCKPCITKHTIQKHNHMTIWIDCVKGSRGHRGTTECNTCKLLQDAGSCMASLFITHSDSNTSNPEPSPNNACVYVHPVYIYSLNKDIWYVEIYVIYHIHKHPYIY